MIPFVLSQLADLYTALDLPPGAEVNPLPALLLHFPPAAVLYKFVVIVLLLEAAKLDPRLHLVKIGTIAGIVGTISNIQWATVFR